MKLESIGKIIASGFGDRVLVGIITRFLENVSPGRAYEYIKDNKQLGYWVSDSDWGRFRRMAKGASIRDITTEDIIKELRKSNPDILGVILNHPEGLNWLDRQLAEMKKKLEIE